MELFIGGGVILIYLGLVVACLLWVLFWARRRDFEWKGKATSVLAVLLAAYAIPFGDHTIGLINFNRLCADKAGLRVHQTVPVDGFMWETGRQIKPYTTYGYRFVEIKTARNDIYRYVLGSDGVIEELKIDIPNAKFLARGVSSTAGKHIGASEFVIMDRETGREIASHSAFHYRGGWLFRSLSGIGVTGPNCPSTGPQLVPSAFIQSVLIPRE